MRRGPGTVASVWRTWVLPVASQSTASDATPGGTKWLMRKLAISALPPGTPRRSRITASVPSRDRSAAATASNASGLPAMVRIRR
jgi:hypothetical protein